MTESTFTSLSDQATLVYNSVDLSVPHLPVTAGNSQLVKEFLIQEPKADVRIDMPTGHFQVKRVFDEGVGLMFELLELNNQQTQNVSMAILSQQECSMDIRTVNGFKLFLETMGAEQILL